MATEDSEFDSLEAGIEFDMLVWRAFGGSEETTIPPRFSTSIKSAWEIVEKLTADEERDHPLYFKCTYRWWYESDREPTAIASFDWKLTGDRHPLYSATAGTMPLAICRAALKAVRE